MINKIVPEIMTRPIELEALLGMEVVRVGKKRRIKILAGHFPILYNDDNTVFYGIDRWGAFSEYSFELGLGVVECLQFGGQPAEMILLADDDIELPKQIVDGKVERLRKSWHKRKSKKLLLENKLPEEYTQMIGNSGLEKFDFATQERGGITTRILSEYAIRHEAHDLGLSGPNECSLSYKGILNNPTYFNKDTDHLISFIPGQCKGNICAGVLDKYEDISATHIFFPSIEVMGGLFDTGDGFKKVGEPLTIDELFATGQVTYRIDGM